MTLEQYQKDVQRTLPDLGTYQLNICHMIFGMNSEFSELYEATDDVNRGEELTDVAWYFNNYCNFLNLDLFRIIDFIPNNGYYKILEDDDYIEQLEVQISKLTDLEKKEMAYKKIIDRTTKIDLIVKIFQALNDCYSYYNINPFDAMQKNIDKLKARYPEKFTEHHALNRDLVKERHILEGKNDNY